ncbi:MAG: phosphatidylserine decarboxylase [Cryomorphaceae bacterium BACL11 MAG-121128-bin16]|nr:MAG: phosphatidylserine decarboxylase [Cryomorphaceae bacterium BACL11 MAG-121128-bin16]
MKLHKEGYKSIRNEIIILILLGFFSYISDSKIVDSLYAIMIFIFVITLNFFRIPKRTFERQNDIIYSPCDGKVVVIEETLETEYYKDKRIQVSVFMSPLNVHNNLYPISGMVTYTKYHPGKFLVAWNPKASTDNERSTVVVENNKISVLCRQIAGALARRIITYSKAKDSVNSADEIGFIKFGSRVDLFLPIGTKIDVVIGDKVIGGQSVIAKY